MLTSLTETDGLVELHEETTRLEPGTEVDFLPYSELRKGGTLVFQMGPTPNKAWGTKAALPGI